MPDVRRIPGAGGKDPFDLERFVDAQRGTYDRACAELRSGVKTTHWIWFVFPQMRGLGRSAIAARYGLSSLAEARAYLAHPLLGPRLVAIAGLACAIKGKTAREVFGSPDDLKVRSSMTLFGQAADDPAPFQAVLDHYYGGDKDPATLALI